MGNLSGIFDGVGQKPTTSEALPEGQYLVTIAKAEVKETKAKDGHYINVQYKVIDGQFVNRVVFGRYNIRNKNPDAQRIGQEQFYQLREALGMQSVQDTNLLEGKSLFVKLGVKKGMNDEPENTIKAHLANGQQPKPQAQPQAQAQAQTSAVPPWAKQQNQDQEIF